MKMKKGTGLLVLILTAALIVVLAFSCISGFGANGTSAADNIKLGLDLAGGVSITYKVVDEDATSDDISDTIYKLQKRVEGYSTESSVYLQGEDRINIEIPGVSDANAILEELGKPGSLYFITATDANGNSTFTYDGTVGNYVLNYTQEELEANGAVVLYGTDIADAQGGTQADELKNTEYVVKLTMTEEGKEKFADATTANIGKQIAIVWDDAIISAPTVENAITGGQAVITNQADMEEANNLATSIRIGGLSVTLEELSSSVVGAQLGGTAISTSITAGIIGLAIVFILMCVLYLLPGFASGLALLIYVGLTVLCIDAFNITLTLPGIAGVILAIGMAVDANVIIFARVKEEIGSGKSVSLALKTGFQKALSAILDGNITTLIAAIVLALKGSGPVKGFAQTLALGIIVSMFTALVITRLIIYALYAVGLKEPKLYGIQKARKPRHFTRYRMKCFIVSGALIVIGVLFMVINGFNPERGGLNYSLEFKGGTSTSVPFEEDYTIDEIEANIVPEVVKITGSSVQVNTIAGSKEVVFKSNTLPLDKRQALEDLFVNEYGVDADQITMENISATISSEMRADAVVAIIIAVVCMLLYIWLRFKDIRFAGSAVIALAHDVLIVLAFYAIARVSVGNTFIACMLTIVGYSINATIVIFDRIREKLKNANNGTDLEALVDDSITQTLTRTIYTSLTTFVMVAVLFIMGVTSIREFALPLMVGIVCGAYSSICITGPLWHLFKLGVKKQSKK